MNRLRFISILLTLLISSAGPVSADTAEQQNFLQRQDVQSFVDNMTSQHGFSKDELQQWFAAIRPRPDIIEAISNPAEAKPWHQYRKIFIKEKRITGGVDFWNTHRELLQQAEQKSGVPARIIVAILGVETLYNTYKGRHDVFESLVTLAFDYPKRSRFFRSELEQFLLLAREEKVDPLLLKGSYAGAMGGPQFISSSFRHYAVDFDNDGKRDIWNNPADMIGSVANYFKVHGWQQGQPITFMASVNGSGHQAAVDKGIKPYYSIRQLAEIGVRSYNSSNANPDDRAALIRLDQVDGPEYWMGLKNFYVITRYNHSPLYAMAVYQLSEEIAARMKVQ
jgi:membrane-bound lytic murein transglycosylase B